jgi:Tfp pilus assembly protein FimT
MVEVMVVAGLLGILAAVSIPSMTRSMRRANGQSFAREITNRLRQARDQSMNSGEVILVRLDDDGGEGGRMRVWRTALRNSQNQADMTGSRARRCSQVRAAIDFTGANLIGNFNFGEQSQRHRIVQMWPAMGGGSDGICFQPDGRILGLDGDPLEPAALPSGCASQIVNGRIVTSQIDPVYDVVGNGLHHCAVDRETQARRGASDVYDIRINFNGSIEMRQ